MTRPKYSGRTTYIPPSMDTRTYFRETVITDWDLSDFLVSGQNEKIFLIELERLVDTKVLGKDVQGFARALKLFYSVEQNLVIANNETKVLLNRNALKGFEHRVVQNELQAGFMNPTSPNEGALINLQKNKHLKHLKKRESEDEDEDEAEE
ncbi:hypothetical protein BGX27_008607 [Mortierella sp. AM989]|nr:hypothetical protein BGX27_008607 [Mortierella sp. AM989]